MKNDEKYAEKTKKIFKKKKIKKIKD